MALPPLIELLSRLQLDGLTDKQRADLNKSLQARKRDLLEAIKAIDRSINALAKKPKKAAKKRRAAKG
jgi:hypothetical protein